MEQAATATNIEAPYTASTCRWFYRWELPKTRIWHALLRSLDDTALAMPDEGF